MALSDRKREQIMAGWFLDPDGPDQLRYFDGTGWTEHRSPNPAVALPSRSPNRRRRRVVVVAALIVVVPVALLIDRAVINRVTGSHQIVYTVTGSAKQSDITYTDSDGTTQQQTGIDVPMVTSGGQEGLTVTLKSGDFFSILAQNASDSGDLTCTVTDDGKVIQRHTAFGAGAIADCDGNVP